MMPEGGKIAYGRGVSVIKGKTPLILSLETATRAGSVSVLRGESPLAVRFGDAKTSHSTHLLEIIKSAIDEAGVALKDIDLYAVAAGPGSFTGLRIGLATAKSFASTLERSCIGVPTLHAIAYGAGASSYTVALIPAGRGEVYAEALKVSDKGDVHSLDAPAHVSPHKLLESVGAISHVKWAGEGAHLYAEAIRNRAASFGVEFRSDGSQPEGDNDSDSWVIVPNVEALSVSVAKLALVRFSSGDNALPQNLHALYVRPSDAELNEQCRD